MCRSGKGSVVTSPVLGVRQQQFHTKELGLQPARPALQITLSSKSRVHLHLRRSTAQQIRPCQSKEASGLDRIIRLVKAVPVHLQQKLALLHLMDWEESLVEARIALETTASPDFLRLVPIPLRMLIMSSVRSPFT